MSESNEQKMLRELVEETDSPERFRKSAVIFFTPFGEVKKARNGKVLTGNKEAINWLKQLAEEEAKKL